MSKIVVVSVRDSAMGSFGRPAFVPSVGVALRSFSDEVNREAQDNQMHQHPEDFELYHLGTFDEESGRFEPHELGAPALILRGKDAARK